MSPVTIDRRAPFVRTMREWADGYRSRGNAEARRYAADHGMAVVMLADDSARVFYREGAKVRQRTIKREKVRWA